MTASEFAKRALPWLGFAVLAALFAWDFYFDVRDRDLFSWMDPYQYYGFTVGVLDGSEAIDSFEIPSIFPFFVMPLLAFEPSVASALWVNVASMLLLLLGVHLLCRELGLRTPSVIVALLVQSEQQGR